MRAGSWTDPCRRVSILLVIVAATMLGCEAPITPERVSPFDALQVTAAIGATGTAEMSSVVTLQGDSAAKVRLDAPADGETTRIGVDDNPVRPTGTMTIVDVTGPRSQITTSSTGVTERTADAATLRIPIWRSTGQSSLADPLVALTVTFRFPAGALLDTDDPRSAPVWLGVDQPRVTRHRGQGADTLTLRGRFHPERNVTAVVPLQTGPFAAVPETPVSQPGSKRAERVFASVERSNDAYFARAVAARTTRNRIAVGYWVTLIAVAVIPLVVSLLGAIRAVVQRRAAAATAPERASEPPGNLPADLVALIDQGAGRLGQRAVAASLLSLIDRDAIEMQSTSSTQFRLRPQAQLPSEVSPADLALLTELGRLGASDPDRWVTAPLPITLEGPWWHQYCRDATRRARQARLITRRFPRGLFVASVIALTFVSMPLWARSPDLATAALLAAGGLLALSFLGGYRLTHTGLVDRARWKAFERHASDSIELRSVSVPAITVWGPHLTAATALGVNATILDEVCRRDASATPTKAETAGSTALLLSALTTAGLLASPSTATAAPGRTPDPVPSCSVGSRSDQRDITAHGRPTLTGAALACRDLHDLDFGQVDLTGADLRRADLRGANFTQATLTDAKLGGADLRGADFGQATMHRAVLDGADLRGADFTQAELPAASLRGAKARGADFGQATLSLADLRDIDATNGDFVQTRLVRVDASGGSFDGADFTQADIGESDFTDASLVRAEVGVIEATAAIFQRADLSGARWVQSLRSQGADLTDAQGLPRSTTWVWLRNLGIVAVALVVLMVVVVRSRSFVLKR